MSAQGVTEGWRAAREWVTPDGGVAIDTLAARFGAARVCAVDAPRCASSYLDTICCPNCLGQAVPPGQSSSEDSWHASAVKRLAAAASRPLPPLHEPEGALHRAREADAAALRAARGWDGGCGERRALSLAEYAAWWRGRAAGRERGALYVKDWHFAAEFPACQARRGPRVQDRVRAGDRRAVRQGLALCRGVPRLPGAARPRGAG